MANISFLFFVALLINSTFGQSNNHEETISISVETPNLKIISAAEKQQPEPEVISTSTVAVIEGGEVVEPENEDKLSSTTEVPAVVADESTCQNVTISRDDCNTRGISQIATIINRFGTINRLCSCEKSKLACPSGVNFLNKIDLAITRNIYNRYCVCKCTPAKKDPDSKTNIWNTFDSA